MHRFAQTRALVRADLHAVADILDATELFPSEMLADMVAPFLEGGGDHHWLVACLEGNVVGFAYCEPERVTDRTHNLLAIAVRPDQQKQGVGAALVTALEADLAAAGGRILIVETSSLDAYRSTRSFYTGLGYTREAEIRDFYADGDNKVVFWKRL